MNKTAPKLVAALIAAIFIISWIFFAGYQPYDYGNLLKETNHGTRNFILLDNGYNGILEANGKGIQVTNISSSASGGKWFVLFYNDRHSRDILSGPRGEEFVFSFDIKTNKDTEISVSHRETNSQNNQIEFGAIRLKRSDEYTRVSLTGSLIGVDPTSQGIYINLSQNSSGTCIIIKNLKLERVSSQYDF